MNNPREAAFLAILTSVKKQQYVSDFLKKWRFDSEPNSRDFNFAHEIAFGTVRMALALDHIALGLTDNKKLNLKAKEKVLVRMAIYQHFYMDKVPIYAIVNESLELANKYCHKTFSQFLNAILRKLGETSLPEAPISIRYSYPEYFVKLLIEDYGFKKAEEILQLGNKPGVLMARERKTGNMVLVGNELLKFSTSPEYYIQNATPAALISALSEGIKTPKRILDLCASPGGKLIAIHDKFPNAELFANDVSEEKLTPIAANCKKYGINVTLSCIPGEKFQSEEPFDLIILDVPCSNSGVLNKRPEARWRISLKNLEQLEKLQCALVENALKLLSDGGEIWYLTCSIMKRENEAFIEKIGRLNVRKQVTILPTIEGRDGGFASALKKS